jgi:hypothetical protein
VNVAKLIIMLMEFKKFSYIKNHQKVNSTLKAWTTFKIALL